MIKIAELDGNGREQFMLLKTPLGQKGSGYIRYGAAMYFYKSGMLPQSLLEMYRKCCKLDHEDPLAAALHDKILTEDEYDALSRILY